MKKSSVLFSAFLAFVLCASMLFSVCACADDAVILDDQAVRAVQLTGDSAEFDCGGVTVSGGTVTISAPGIYSFTGTLNDGQIIVNVKDEQVQLILAGVNITSRTGAAIYVSEADKVTVEVQDGTENTVVSGTEQTASTFDSSRTGAAIYSSEDLKFKGNGTLHVYGNLNNGIGSKKDLDIKNCTLHVEAVNNGIKGNNSVEITNASVSILAGNDGIKTDTDKEGKGYVTVTGSSLDILAAEGITAVGQITIVP